MKTLQIVKQLVVCAIVSGVGALSWEVANAGPGDFLPGSVAAFNGDVNADGTRDLSDSIYLLSYLFAGGPAPTPLSCEPDSSLHNGDVNGSGVVDMSDAIYILNWLFQGTAEPREGCPLD